MGLHCGLKLCHLYKDSVDTFNKDSTTFLVRASHIQENDNIAIARPILCLAGRTLKMMFSSQRNKFAAKNHPLILNFERATPNLSNSRYHQQRKEIKVRNL